MNDEAALRDKLRKIEALFSGAGTVRKPPPALRRNGSAPGCEKRRHGRSLSRSGSACPILGRGRCSSRCAGAMACGPTDTPRMRRQSVIVRAPETFLNGVLWPEFEEINAALSEYLSQVSDKVIREAVYKDSSDADEVPEPAKIGPSWGLVGTLRLSKSAKYSLEAMK
jgi:hypothetical protein